MTEVTAAFVHTGAMGEHPDCPSVMCLEPCPQGEYLALNDQGCETCDCYDPCEVKHTYFDAGLRLHGYRFL